jgi:hypothetical protein
MTYPCSVIRGSCSVVFGTLPNTHGSRQPMIVQPMIAQLTQVQPNRVQL